MTATTTNRNTVEKDGKRYALGVAASTKIPQGVIVCRNSSGKAINGATSNAVKALGVSEKMADNSSGAADAISVEYRSGCFKFGNSASGDLITTAEIGTDCYIVDNQTVAKTSDSSARSRAGVVDSIDPDGGVWVWIGVQY